MATITPRLDDQGNRIGWQARIRKKGFPPQVKTFRKKAEAEAWASTVESEMARGVFIQRTESEQTTLHDLLDRYSREVLPKLKGGHREQSRVKALQAGLGAYSLAALNSSVIAKYRDKRLSTTSSKTGRTVSAQTVKHELGLLQRALKRGAQEWGIALPGGIPTSSIKMPKAAAARDRRLEPGEEERLLAACEEARNAWLRPVVIFAVETGMRAGEILETKGTAGKNTPRPVRSTGLLWKHVDLEKRVALLPMTKNGEARIVPLSGTAVEVLKALPRSIDGRTFGTTYEAVHLAFVRACRRAGINDFRFHDLRHEATSRFFEKGLNPLQVCSITGHKTLQMLRRYTHLRAEDLAKLLA